MADRSDTREALTARLVEGSPSDVWTQQDVYEFVAALEAERDSYAAQYDEVVAEAGALVEERDRLEAERDTLREALDYIEGSPEDPLHVQAIARAALVSGDK